MGADRGLWGSSLGLPDNKVAKYKENYKIGILAGRGKEMYTKVDLENTKRGHP